MELLNNIGTERPGDTFDKAISASTKLSIISSCPAVCAYGGLKIELSKIDEACFLFSEFTFIERMVDEKDPREFEVARRRCEMDIGGPGFELKLRSSPNQHALVREYTEWICLKDVFKSTERPSAIQSGGTYVTENPSNENHVFNGAAASLIQERLGYEQRPDIVTLANHFEERKEVGGLETILKSVRNNPAMVEEVANQVAVQVEKLYRENPPKLAYFLTLYHLFWDSIEGDEYNGTRLGIKLEDSVVWSKLYDFQRDAVVGTIRELKEYKGCTIAGSVGSGKTCETLAVTKYYEERSNHVLVLCPKHLRENQTLWMRGNDDCNPFAEDRLSYDVLDHTDLNRYYGVSGSVDLEHSQRYNYDLLVIGESHNFRSKSTDADKRDRHIRLIEDVIKAGVHTKVPMLSVALVNNKLLDLHNQIELITEGDDEYLAHTDGVPFIAQVTRVIQVHSNEQIKRDDSERMTKSFVGAVSADYFKLPDVLTIARSHKHITKYYGTENGTFSICLKPVSFQIPIDTENELPPIGALNDTITRLMFAQHQALSYVRNDRRSDCETLYVGTWGKGFESQVNRMKIVANLVRVNVLKRMEPSVDSFRTTLQRILDGCVEFRKRPDEIGAGVGYDVDESSLELDTGDDAKEFGVGDRVCVDLHDVDALRLNQDLGFDINTLRKLLQYAETMTSERDARLLKLREFTAYKVNDPLNPDNCKVLVSSAFADITDYLSEYLTFWLRCEPDIECAEMAGSSTRMYSLKLTRTTSEDTLVRLSPISKESPEQMCGLGEIDVIFVTDCIPEGQNLQDCDCLANYDTHWNPVRIVQRSGRIDRLGSTNSQIQLVNSQPSIAPDDYIQLESRARGRMTPLDTSITGEENVLGYKDRDEVNDFTYRCKQPEQLQNEALDLEDISGGIPIADFAYDDLRIEPQCYAKEHPGLFENSLLGLRAVTFIPDKLHNEVKSGVVFCLKQVDGPVNPQNTSLLFSHYLVYMSNDGEITARHIQSKSAFDIMRAVYSGHIKPVADLCHEFSRETHDGTKIGTYTEMLNDVVFAVTGVQQDKGTGNLFSPGEVRNNVVKGFDDYPPVCFVMIK